jgi:hypothetical protein
MKNIDARWAGVEVAVTQQPDDPDGFRVVFERRGPKGNVRLAVVHVAGADDPEVVRFIRPTGADTTGPDRVEFERKALAVVQNLAEAMAWD